MYNNRWLEAEPRNGNFGSNVSFSLNSLSHAWISLSWLQVLQCLKDFISVQKLRIQKHHCHNLFFIDDNNIISPFSSLLS